MASRWSKTHRVFAPHAVEDVDLAPSSPLAIWGLFKGKTRGNHGKSMFFFPSKIIKYSYMTLIDVLQGSSMVLLDHFAFNKGQLPNQINHFEVQDLEVQQVVANWLVTQCNCYRIQNGDYPAHPYFQDSKHLSHISPDCLPSGNQIGNNQFPKFEGDF